MCVGGHVVNLHRLKFFDFGEQGALSDCVVGALRHVLTQFQDGARNLVCFKTTWHDTLQLTIG